jgi:hypothetical protein
MKRPSFQFYPSDWLRDTALRSCSTGARGLWMDMICFMHEGSPYGHLKVGDKVILAFNLSRMVGETLEVVEGWLDELSTAGVYETTDEGVIYSKRMIRDENLRQIRAAGGSKGGNPALMDKGKVNLEVKQEVNQKSTPSSTSSSSSSKDKKATKVAATVVACPPDVSESVWLDWLQLRKAKKAPVTQTVVNSAIMEAAKADLTLNDFLTIWCARGSQGLQADWLKANERQPFANKYDVAHVTTPPPPNQDAALRKIEEDRKKAVPPSLETLAKLAELRKQVV